MREWVFDHVVPLVHALPGVDPGQPTTSGRSCSCDVPIRNDTIGKLHATVIFDSDASGYHLTNQGSRHGTHIGGEKLASGMSVLLAWGTS